MCLTDMKTDVTGVNAGGFRCGQRLFSRLENYTEPYSVHKLCVLDGPVCIIQSL
uniref:Uncharacterized protein n=1 Tax=Anguilla anguilla TaxID=7936 RepID=A0A0E9XMG9_ANGAN